jgi:DNA-binding NarL/FixJ family response regulator
LQYALRECRGPRPYILILDHEVLSGIEPEELCLGLALHPSARVLSLVEDPDAEDLVKWLRAGISGFIPRGSSFETVRMIIASVLAGEIWASRKLTSTAMRGLICSLNDSRFTPREIEILRRIAVGEDNQEIADALCVTRDTVRWHLRSAYSKMGIHDRRSAGAMFAVARR